MHGGYGRAAGGPNGRAYALGQVGMQRAFNLRPDLLITLPTGEIIVADTKWKRLNATAAPTFDIANADAYQMLAYSEVFQASQVFRTLHLLYPHLPDLPARIHPIQLAGGRTLYITTLPLDGQDDEPWSIQT